MSDDEKRDIGHSHSRGGQPAESALTSTQGPEGAAASIDVDWKVGPEWGARPERRRCITQVETGIVRGTIGEENNGGEHLSGRATVSLRFTKAVCESNSDSGTRPPDSLINSTVAGFNSGNGAEEGIAVEGNLKFQLFKGHRSCGDAVFMHPSSCFYAWVSTSQRSQGGVKLNGIQLDKLSKDLKRRCLHSMELCVAWV